MNHSGNRWSRAHDNHNRNLASSWLLQLLALGISLQAWRQWPMVRMARRMARLDNMLAVSLRDGCLVLVEGGEVSKVEWKDVSSFSQNTKREDRIPKSFSMYIAGERLTVTRHIHYAPDEWIASYGGMIGGLVVGNGSAEDAKSRALTLVRDRLNESILQINELIGAAP